MTSHEPYSSKRGESANHVAPSGNANRPRRPRFGLGPGLLVTAAFIGPGTVTTASQAGARFGYDLAWALLFAVLATIVLQEMAARLGVVARLGLGEAMRNSFRPPLARGAAVVLVIAAITFGNAAYQMGNLTGAALGLQELFPLTHEAWVAGIALLAAALLAVGRYRWIERGLVAMVVLMSVVFVATAIQLRPDPSALLQGCFARWPDAASLTTALALVGTTVVPYNLFLHASAARQRWSTASSIPAALAAARLDTVLSVSLGGVVTLAILMTAAAIFTRGTTLHSAAEMAGQLEPLLGRWAKAFFALGLASAGVTSAITAPLAAAYATCGAMGWSVELRAARFRAVWLIILLTGTGFALAGYRPVPAIVFAQAANALVLPLIAGFLLVVMNQSGLLGRQVNGRLANLAGAAVVLVTVALGASRLISVF